MRIFLFSWSQSSPDYHRSHHRRRSRSPSPQRHRLVFHLTIMIIYTSSSQDAALHQDQEEDHHHLRGEEEGVYTFYISCIVLYSFAVYVINYSLVVHQFITDADDRHHHLATGIDILEGDNILLL